MLEKWFTGTGIFAAIDEWWTKEIEAFISDVEMSTPQEHQEWEQEIFEVLIWLLAAKNTSYVKRMLDVFPEWMGSEFLYHCDDNLLSFCIMRKNTRMLEFLLEYGVDPNQHDWEKDGLDTAIRHEDFEAVLMLLSHGAKVNFYHLEKANQLQNGKILDQLLHYSKRCAGMGLNHAVEQNWLEGVRVYLAHEADVNFEDFEGKGALDHAQSEEMRSLLVAAGAKSCEQNAETVILDQETQEYEEEKKLLELLKSYSDNMDLALQRMAGDWDEDSVAMLLERLAHQGHFELLRHIIPRVKDRSVLDQELYSVVLRPQSVWKRSWQERWEMVQDLNEWGVKVGGDPIYAICMNTPQDIAPSEEPVVINLLEFFRMRGCKLDDYMADGLGDTALGCAIMTKNELCINWLLKNGVQAHELGEDSLMHLLFLMNPFDEEWVRRMGKKLMAAGMEPDFVDPWGNTILHTICEFCPPDDLKRRIRVALEWGADPYERNNRRKTAYELGMARDGADPQELEALK